VAYATALSEVLVEQLGRIGIDPTQPSDLYRSGDPAPTSGLIDHRVTFHAVGKILSGPALWKEWDKVGTVRNYVRPSGAPEGLGLSIGAARKLPDRSSWHAQVKGTLIEVDFRLPVPWLLDEPVPSRAGGTTDGAVFRKTGHR